MCVFFLLENRRFNVFEQGSMCLQGPEEDHRHKSHIENEG